MPRENSRSRLSRRRFLGAGAGALAWAACPWARGAPSAVRKKAPFRLLYSNDATNLVSCVSPFHRRGEPFSREQLCASIDEAAAADVQLLQPGLTFVPLWRSRVYPMTEHLRWWRATFPGSPVHELAQFVEAGGDLVGVFVEHCRARGVAPFVSLRVNDYHRVERLDLPAGTALESFDALTLDRFRREHPEFRLQPPGPAGRLDPTGLFAARDAQVLDWAHEEVRERFLAFACEVVDGHDLAGLELDFLRHFRLFDPDRTPAAGRCARVNEVIARLRARLDARPGPRCWLAVRIPAVKEAHAPLGLDLPALAAAGVDLFTLSSNYYTVQQDLDVAAVRARVPEAAVYLEMTHCTVTGQTGAEGPGDNFRARRTDDAQFLTTAALARRQGADGVSLFNFAYFREYGRDPARGPFGEPPFALLPQLARAGSAPAPANYFLSPAWRSPFGNRLQLPARIAAGATREFHLEIIRPAGGWRAPGWLRLQAEEPWGDGSRRLRWAGRELEPGNSFPADSHPALRGSPETTRIWRVPVEALQDGPNRLDLTVLSGVAVKVIFLELLLP